MPTDSPTPDERRTIVTMWVVDDDIESDHVADHLCTGVKNCVERLGGGAVADAKMERVDDSTVAGTVMAGSLRWKYTLSFPKGSINASSTHARALEFVLWGFSNWDRLAEFLTGDAPAPMGKRMWPAVVFTDLYRGYRTTPLRPEDVTELPGYKLALQCVAMGIPCVAFTSSDAMVAQPNEFQVHGLLKFHNREEFKADGHIPKLFDRHLWPLISRRLWLPEFTLAVRGYRQDQNRDAFTVVFYRGDKVVSRKNGVTPTQYCYLYLWAHGSVQAVLQGWKPETFHLHPAIVKKSESYSTSIPIFAKKFYRDHKAEIHYPPGLEAPKRKGAILNANIVCLDPPTTTTLPAFWRNDHDARGKLLADMKQILPPDGLAWLESLEDTGKPSR